MSPWLIAAVGAAYLYVGAEHAARRDWPMALVWCAYAVANAGFVWLELRR